MRWEGPEARGVGSPAALLDLADISGASGLELCRKAEDLGVDLGRFAVQGKD